MEIEASSCYLCICYHGNVFTDLLLRNRMKDALTYRQQGDLTSLHLYFQKKEIKLKKREASMSIVCILSACGIKMEKKTNIIFCKNTTTHEARASCSSELSCDVISVRVEFII
jgi:hypothetical protein